MQIVVAWGAGGRGGMALSIVFLSFIRMVAYVILFIAEYYSVARIDHIHLSVPQLVSFGLFMPLGYDE